MGTIGPWAVVGAEKLDSRCLGQTDWSVLELGSVREQEVWSLLALEDLGSRELAGVLLAGSLRTAEVECHARPPCGSVGIHLCPVGGAHAQES